MKELLRKYISHWAFIPLNQLGDDDSLKAKRIDFGMVSKLGMIVDAVYPQKLDIADGDMIMLDTVNDFVKYLKSKGCTKINVPPEG